MIIGTLVLVLRIPENSSLKGKRGVVKSVCARLQNEFRVAAAEVESNDLWQIAEIGIACVSNDAAHADSILTRVERFVEQSRLDVELIDSRREILEA